MNTKEKLELLWKYLFLLVVAIGVIRFTNGPHSAKLHFGHGDDHDMLFVGDGKVSFGADDHKMDVKVEEEIVDGDTLVKMWINGEEVDAEQHDMKDGSFKWKSKDGNVMVIDIDDMNQHKGIKKNIIKKKVVIHKQKDD
jgi:hypothetical protein